MDEEKISRMFTTFESIEKSNNVSDEMLAMRKDIYVDEKNIAEALGIVLFDDIHVQQMIRSLLHTKSKLSDSSDIHDTSDEPLDVIVQKSLKEMLRMRLLIEEYQHKGIIAMRHLQELDRQIVSMLVSLALSKHKS